MEISIIESDSLDVPLNNVRHIDTDSNFAGNYPKSKDISEIFKLSMRSQALKLRVNNEKFRNACYWTNEKSKQEISIFYLVFF